MQSQDKAAMMMKEGSVVGIRDWGYPGFLTAKEFEIFVSSAVLPKKKQNNANEYVPLIQSNHVYTNRRSSGMKFSAPVDQKIFVPLCFLSPKPMKKYHMHYADGCVQESTV